jgi:hypothetical protein
MTLFDLSRPCETLAIVGTAKNVGKTTCLNHLIAQVEGLGHRMGLTSVGRDGEDIDVLTDRPKPRITPPPGTLVATSLTSARRSQARLREVGPTPFRTALGPVGLYEVLSPGSVEVAGPVTVEETVALIRMLKDHGARHVFVDGALDRRASASSAVADGVILATGLALADDPGEVARRTATQVDWLTLPAAPPESMASVPGAWRASGEFVTWSGGSLVHQGEALAGWLPEDTTALVLTGAFTDDMARRLAPRPGLTVIVPDGTHLLLDERTFDGLRARGWRFEAARPIRLIAVTLNPTSPTGATTDARAFRMAMGDRLAPIPVFDLHLESNAAPIH